MATKIEWAEETWNPITGCTPVSEGCANCYAKRMAKRLAGRHGYPADDPFRVTFHKDRLGQPSKWRKPRMVFVCSMGDLFHEDVLDEWLHRIFYHMTLFYREHTFLLLTKRPERMRDYILGEIPVPDAGGVIKHKGEPQDGLFDHIWLGVTAENQEQADKRIPILLQTPAAVRFVSVEPMLGPVDLSNYAPFCWKPITDEEMAIVRQTYPFGIPANSLNAKFARMRLGWVICGGEIGPGARPMHPDWARSLRDQCKNADVPFFFKHWGEWEQLKLTKPIDVFDKHAGRHITMIPDEKTFRRVGKKAAGRLLDGIKHNEMPEKGV